MIATQNKWNLLRKKRLKTIRECNEYKCDLNDAL